MSGGRLKCFQGICWLHLPRLNEGGREDDLCWCVCIGWVTSSILDMMNSGAREKGGKILETFFHAHVTVRIGQVTGDCTPGGGEWG